MLPREPGLEREAVSWFSVMYPRTQRPSWPVARPLNIIQVCGRYKMEDCLGVCFRCSTEQPTAEPLPCSQSPAAGTCSPL